MTRLYSDSASKIRANENRTSRCLAIVIVLLVCLVPVVPLPLRYGPGLAIALITLLSWGRSPFHLGLFAIMCLIVMAARTLLPSNTGLRDWPLPGCRPRSTPPEGGPLMVSLWKFHAGRQTPLVWNRFDQQRSCGRLVSLVQAQHRRYSSTICAGLPFMAPYPRRRAVRRRQCRPGGACLSRSHSRRSHALSRADQVHLLCCRLSHSELFISTVFRVDGSVLDLRPSTVFLWALFVFGRGGSSPPGSVTCSRTSSSPRL